MKNFNLFILNLILDNKNKRQIYILSDDHLWYIHSAFEQIRIEKMSNPKIRKDRRMEQLFRERFANDGFSSISYKAIINNYNKFISKINLKDTEPFNDNYSINSSIDSNTYELTQYTNDSTSDESEPRPKQILISTSIERTLSNQFGRSLSISQSTPVSFDQNFEIQRESNVKSKMNVQTQNHNQRASTPIQLELNSSESLDQSVENNNDSLTSNSSNNSVKRRRRKCLTYRGQKDRETNYRLKKVVTESFESDIGQQPQANITVDYHSNLANLPQENNNNRDFIVRNDPSLHNRNFYHQMHGIGLMDRDEDGQQVNLFDLGLFGGEIANDNNGQARYQYQCSHCDALFYGVECNTSGLFTSCCLSNKVNIEHIPDFPEEYSELFTRNNTNRVVTQERKKFLDYIINYNSLLSFAAISARLDSTVENFRNHYVYKIHGRMYHRIAPANRTEGQNFHMQGGQYYMLDTDQAHRDRMENSNQVFNYIDENVIFKLKIIFY